MTLVLPPPGVIGARPARAGRAPAALPAGVTLRPLVANDFDLIHQHLCDPLAVHMAALTLKDAGNREAFDAAWQTVQADPQLWLRAVLLDGRMVGHIACFSFMGGHEVGYWLDRSCWGQGVATRALRRLLKEVGHRPLCAHVAHDNAASLRVLHKCGFRPTDQLRTFAWGRGEEIDVQVLTLRKPTRLRKTAI